MEEIFVFDLTKTPDSCVSVNEALSQDSDQRVNLSMIYLTLSVDYYERLGHIWSAN